jgi:hypothetical protein
MKKSAARMAMDIAFNIRFSESLGMGIFIGYTFILFIALILNKFGDMMFRKGFAKPFYLRGHRIHHRDVLLLVLPVTYTVIVSLIVMGIVSVVWDHFWNGIATVSILALVCLFVDILFDRCSSQIKRIITVPHEVVYLTLPFYVFTHIVVITV